MTRPKQVAQSLTGILETPLMERIRNKSRFLDDETIERVLNFWDFDLFTRNPSVAYLLNDDGEEEKYTTLDMATFLFALMRRNAIITLPEYDPRRPKDHRTTQVRLSGDNRFGQVLNLTSNAEVFTFGFRIKDQGVLKVEDTRQELGAYRTYLVTDFNGTLYDGWKDLEFVPTLEENAWFADKNIWQEDKVHFDRFVTPEKWQSFYGKYYFVVKALIDRLVAERQELKRLRDDMVTSGIRFPPSDGMGSDWKYEDDKKHGDYDSIEVDCFEVEIDIPDHDSEWQKPKYTSSNLKTVADRPRKINKYLERLRFLARSVELAFANKHDPAAIQSGTFMYPHWIKDCRWEQEFRFPKKQKRWNRLKIIQPSVGELSVGIRFRYVTKKQQIAKN